MKKLSNFASTAKENLTAKFYLALTTVFLSFPSFADGLDDGTDTVNEVVAWFYIALGSIVSGFTIYEVLLAFFDKKSWADVMTTLIKVAAAGGILAATAFAWSIWGT